MPYRIGIRPSKPTALLGMIAGVIFVVLSLTWAAIAGFITIYHGYNSFSAPGISTYEVGPDSAIVPQK